MRRFRENVVRGVWLRSGLMDDSPAMAARTNTPTSRFKEEKGRGKPRRGQWEGRDEAQKSLCLTCRHAAPQCGDVKRGPD